MKKYVWCEDRGSGFKFWTEVFKILDSEITVETKNNNSQLRKAVCNIKNDGNEYYILMDSFVDNADVLREIDKLKRSTIEKKNVRIVDIHSFEFALLSFESLIEWAFAVDDELKEIRNALLQARELLIEQILRGSTIENKIQIETLFPYSKNHNSEQIVAELLYEITRNTGFETDKGKLGDCFVVDCCTYLSREDDDACGLNEVRLSNREKINQLVNKSILKTAFEKVGLL